jgi:hypothetical protein
MNFDPLDPGLESLSGARRDFEHVEPGPYAFDVAKQS